jgi:uncharacterized membrane protein YidH (DUF202 family)
VTRLSPEVDPGLQNERTVLAWRRTALSLLVAAATMAKVTASSWHVVALVWLLIGVPGAAGIVVASSIAYRARRADRSSFSPWALVLLGVVVTVGIGVLAGVSVLV